MEEILLPKVWEGFDVEKEREEDLERQMDSLTEKGNKGTETGKKFSCQILANRLVRSQPQALGIDCAEEGG